MDILGKITQLRTERGWSIYKLAEEAGLTQSTLANMFSRKTLPSIFSLQQICLAFGITLSEFFSENKNISADELKLLGEFRKLNHQNKQLILKIMEVLKN